MWTKILAVIVLTRAVRSGILKAEVSYEKPKERNNVLNKGVWVRNKLTQNMFDKTRIGDFIFRENSLDVDNLLQNTFDPFSTNYREDAPSFSNYIKRAKRAIRDIHAQRLGKNLKNCVGKECKTLEQEKEEPSKGIKKDDSDEKNTSAINDYPYEVAILLNNNKREAITHNDTQAFENEINNLTRVNDIVQQSAETEDKENNTLLRIIPIRTSPTRSKKYDFESEVIKKIEISEVMNRSQEYNEGNGNKIINRNIFDKENTVWHQNAPIPNVNVYKVVPKEPKKSKAVTERGLIKVISMLTKTFKKIIKQHHEIKSIHERITDINDQFIKNSGAMTNKFQDFDVKYLYLLKLHEKIKSFELKLAAKQEYFQNKEKEMSNNFKEFETQQKKFLQQQRQFYNIQKLMLAQNEKINIKQNAIAKTQSEISHRQNNFARILKKAKQLYLEARNPIPKLSSNLIKNTQHAKSIPQNSQFTTTTPSTESVKINLFSIPTSNKIENQDDMIIKEKDDQTIDDLVYKYYFNNTFIDNIMKNNVLTSLMGVVPNPGASRNVKNKRNELETTILLPVLEDNDSEAFVTKNRERRWINHHSRHRGRRRERGKGGVATIINATDAKPIKKEVVNNIRIVDDIPKEKDEGEVKIKYDPFLAMATNFCNEIRENTTAQTLQWCVEKALRRLRVLDKDHTAHITDETVRPILDVPKTTIKEWVPKKVKKHSKVKALSIEINTEPITKRHSEPITELNTVKMEETTSLVSTVPAISTVTDTPTTQSQLSSTSESPSTVTQEAQTEMATSISDAALFFPDNDVLESNLQEFDLKPDTEGNVYFEGSFHASDIQKRGTVGNAKRRRTAFELTGPEYVERIHRGKVKIQELGKRLALLKKVDSDSQDMDDFMPGIDSNSRIDMDPMTFDLQAQRRAIVRKLNEKIKMSLG